MLSFVLAGALAPFPDPKVEPIPAPEDCVRAEKIKRPAAKPHQPVTVKAKRLFRSDPKPIVEPCGTLPPAPPFTFAPEVPGEFSPVPEVPFALGLPVPEVPPVAPGPCLCDGESPGGAGVGGGLNVVTYSSAPYIYAGPVALVPEPSEWSLLALGLLGVLGWKAKP